MKIERYAQRKKRERRLYDPCFVFIMLAVFVVLSLFIYSSIVSANFQDLRDKYMEAHKNHTKELKEIEDSVENRKNGVELNQARRYYEIDE